MNFNGKRLIATLVPLLAWLAGALPAALAQEMPPEQLVRAAMVFNFLKFTEFPVDVGASLGKLRLCYAVRDTRQVEALIALGGRKVGGRELQVVDFAAREGDCQVYYVDSRQRWRQEADNPALRRALTISAFRNFVGDGGMIEIATRDEGIQFDIDLDVARRAGFRFSPYLLRLKREIHD